MKQLDIRPFQGYRYRLDRPSDLGRYTSPPYDMLDETAVEGLYARDPHNVVRIIQNRRAPSDRSNADRHGRAARLFGEWIAGGVLARDPSPSLYVYKQTYTTPLDTGGASRERLGLVCCVKTVEFEEGVIVPHERTLSAPKQDRYEHREALRADTELIFGILSDDSGTYARIREAARGAPCGEFTDTAGVVHSLHRCSDPGPIGALQQAVATGSVLIADGHHRYETALAYARANPGQENGYVMMALVSAADPGLTILPFHRLVRRGISAVTVETMAALSGYFECADLGGAEPDKLFDFIHSDGGPRMLFYSAAEKRLYGLELSGAGREYIAAHADGMSAAWCDLDVSVINQIWVRAVLGLAPDGATLHDVIEYMNDPPAALARAADDTAYYGCFFIRPVGISVIRRIVDNGERMPQKSTNFFPKFFSGLVFNRMGDNA
jgi:uncharacterized protein (DUF1015 family)